MAALICILSLSARRAWIEISLLNSQYRNLAVALRKESVDRNNLHCVEEVSGDTVALRKESVDRNAIGVYVLIMERRSLSARRAWIEIT